jgi:hypothetical protein
LDALVFTAGIGQNSPVIRERVCQGLTWLGVRIDPDANERGNGCVSPEGCTPSAWVIPTDEEAVIASHTLAVVRSPAARARWRTPGGVPPLTFRCVVLTVLSRPVHNSLMTLNLRDEAPYRTSLIASER